MFIQLDDVWVNINKISVITKNNFGSRIYMQSDDVSISVNLSLEETIAEINKVLATKKEKVTVNPWQNISTAPMNGTRILLTSRDEDVYIGAWHCVEKKWKIPGTIFFGNPTHWMPLSAPPAA